MLLNRPKDAQEQRGQWNMETVNELLGKALKLKQMEAQDMCDSFFKIDTKIGDMYTLLKKAVDINSEIIFN